MNIVETRRCFDDAVRIAAGSGVRGLQSMIVYPYQPASRKGLVYCPDPYP